MYYLSGRVESLSGDITKIKADIIVNPANSTLYGGGGVDGLIHKLGGSQILEECKVLRQSRFPDGLPAGEAVYTNAGNLHYKYIIHTVGPLWKNGLAHEAEILSSCYMNTLTLCKELNCNSIAFPSISTGAYRFPKELAAQIVSETLDRYFSSNTLPQKVLLVFYSEADKRIFDMHNEFDIMDKK